MIKKLVEVVSYCLLLLLSSHNGLHHQISVEIKAIITLTT
uniref:Uncharacterized protein n=1 Tax=Tetranychus urticae TaxID=32264 RepID=T1KB67_TETUR